VVFRKFRFLRLWKFLGYWTLDAQEWKGGLQALNTAMSVAPPKRHFISTKTELQYQYITYNALNIIPPL
jgi:hypothetical protein